MSENASISTGIAARYATAIFELAKDDKALPAIEKDVKVNVAVDESLIGGLIVKVGSKMIDTSIASKLANLQNAMKEVG